MSVQQVEIQVTILKRTKLGAMMKQTLSQYKKQQAALYLISAMRDAFLEMKPIFTDDERSIQCASQMCPKNGTIKLKTGTLTFTETADLKAAFFPNKSNDPPEQFAKTGPVWDWTNPLFHGWVYLVGSWML